MECCKSPVCYYVSINVASLLNIVIITLYIINNSKHLIAYSGRGKYKIPKSKQKHLWVHLKKEYGGMHR